MGDTTRISLQYLDYIQTLFSHTAFWSIDSQEIVEIVVVRCYILRLKCTEFDCDCGLEPAGGAY